MDAAILQQWLTLHFAPGLGPVRFQALFNHYHSIEQIIAADIRELRLLGLPGNTAQAIHKPDQHAIDNALSWAQNDDCYLLTLDDARYPHTLKQIADPPLLLYVRGNIAALSAPQMAIVGSRNPSPMGADNAYAFAAELARFKFVISSGLAMGIDAAAHQGALSVTGRTIAVMGTGLNRIYPACHHQLVQDIIDCGAVISEFALDSPPLANHFPRRNRIISGMSLGVLVIEAARQSGSLITAQQAVEQGREVFALPGSIHNPHAKGCHYLIKQGAKLVDDVSDIINELGINYTPISLQDAPVQVDSTCELDSKQLSVLTAVGDEPTSVDSVIIRSGLTSEQVCSMLLVLEVEGYLQMTATGQYCRVKKRTVNERKYSRCTHVSV